MTATQAEPETQEAAPIAERPRFTPPRKGDIFKLMSQVMAKIKAVGKSHENVQQKYYFRSIDDAYDAVQPALVEAGVFCTPRVVSHQTEETVSGSGSKGIHMLMLVEFEWCAPDGSSIISTALGEATDYADKAANKAMTAAYKYTLLQTFCIPLGEGGKDRDADYSHPKQTGRKGAPASKPASGGSRKPTNYAAKDTPGQAVLRKEIFDAIMGATKGASKTDREAWLKSLTAFKDVPGVTRLEHLSAAKPGAKTGRLEILHAGIKKGKIDKAAFAEWQEKRNADATREAQDKAAEAPQAAPPDLLPPEGDEEDDTIPFDHGPVDPDVTVPKIPATVGKRGEMALRDEIGQMLTYLQKAAGEDRDKLLARCLVAAKIDMSPIERTQLILLLAPMRALWKEVRKAFDATLARHK